MKNKFSREAKIGLVTIIALFLLYFGINYLKGVDIFKPANLYYVKFKNVTELQKSAPVYVEGFKVGLVNEIRYDYENNDGIIVAINLDESMRVQTGSFVKITTGLTTGASLNLELNRHVTTFYAPGDTLEGRNDPGLMDVISSNIMPQVETMLPRLDSILVGLQQVVTHPALSQSLDHIEATTRNLANSTAQLNRMMSGDIPRILSNFNTVSSDLTTLSASLNKIDFQGTMKSVDATLKNLDQVTARMNSKDNTLGLLLNDDQLYNNLNKTAYNASELLFDLKEHPKRYVHFSIW